MPKVGFDKGAKIRRIEGKLDNPAAALDIIGRRGVSESREAFRNQRFENEAWKPRGVPNVFGIIADFAAGKSKPPARRFEATPVLIDSRSLRTSVAHVVRGNVVEWGSNLPYAPLHQFGGPTKSERLTASVQAAIWGWLKGQSSDRKRELGWLLNKKFTGQQIEGRVPERPFVGITPTLMKDVQEILNVKIMEAD